MLLLLLGWSLTLLRLDCMSVKISVVNTGFQMSSAIATASPNDKVISCRGVTKSYGSGEAKVTALRGVDLDVRRGELLMIVGPSGCGKTMLISVITTILDYDAGECRILGRDVQRMSEQERALFAPNQSVSSFSCSTCSCRTASGIEGAADVAPVITMLEPL